MTSVVDLEAERYARERAAYRELQERALRRAFEQHVGRPPLDRQEIVARFPDQVVPNVRPDHWLSPAEIAAALASMATGLAG